MTEEPYEPIGDIFTDDVIKAIKNTRAHRTVKAGFECALEGGAVPKEGKGVSEDAKLWRWGYSKGLQERSRRLYDGKRVFASKSLESPESVCQKCGGKNIVWWVDNEMWNTAIGSSAGILCPSCFVICYEKATGLQPIWELRAKVSKN